MFVSFEMKQTETAEMRKRIKQEHVYNELNISKLTLYIVYAFWRKKHITNGTMEWRGEWGVEIGDRRVGRGEWGLKRRGVRSREV